jgi:formylglycine-generating enzyme required for sulfatase activity
VRRAAWVVAIAAASACTPQSSTLPPAGQLLVYLDTDAIVPTGNALPYGPLDPYPLFDHVRFDVSVNGVPCNDCTRDFQVDAVAINQGQLSFAVLAATGSGALLRARLFRFGDTVGTEPRPETTIDATFAIEAIPPDGILERAIFLGTEDVGTAQGQPKPLTMAMGRPAKFHARTWAPGARVDCPASPQPGEVCIPGGAFWMGSPLEARRLPGSGSQRLVVLSPYYLDAHEVTVAEFRAEFRKTGLPVTPWTGRLGTDTNDFCRFTLMPGDFETYPVNCVESPVAREYCTLLGKDLPTEAQYEYAAGGLRSSQYVWGSDPPTCDAVVMCQKSQLLSIVGDWSCKAVGAAGGPLPIGSGKLDHLDLPTGTVVDLIGNVSEFVRDAWSRLVERCWSRAGLYVDPVCATPGKFDPPPAFTVRGGEWEQAPNRASGRFFRPTGSPTMGFRCARSTTH